VTAGVVRAKYPELWQRTGQPIEQLPVVEKIMGVGGEQTQKVEDTLGERIEKINTRLETEGLSTDAIVKQIAGDNQLTTEIRTQVETIVNQKTQEIQELPQEAMEEIKKEVKQEIRKQMCEEWLKE